MAHKWKHCEKGFLPPVVDLQLLNILHSPSLHAWEVLSFPSFVIHTVYPACWVPQKLHLHLLWPRRSHCSASLCRRRHFLERSLGTLWPGLAVSWGRQAKYGALAQHHLKGLKSFTKLSLSGDEFLTSESPKRMLHGKCCSQHHKQILQHNFLMWHLWKVPVWPALFMWWTICQELGEAPEASWFM